MDDGMDHRPFGSVLGQAISQVGSLMRLDLRLLEAEMRAKSTALASSGACGMAAAMFFALAGFALVQCLILAMIFLGIGPMLACLVVALLLIGAGSMSLYLAKRALTGWTITPVETVNQVRTDLAALKQGIRYGSTQQ